MKKLTLAMDDLRVESFAIDADTALRGTVDANSLPTFPLCSKNGGCQSGQCETVTCTVEWCC